MAIIKCPECGKEISDKSEYCISCGYPIKKYLQERDTTAVKEDTTVSNTIENISGSSSDDLKEIQRKAVAKYSKGFTTGIIGTIAFTLVTIWGIYLASDIEFASIGINIIWIVTGLLAVVFVFGLKDTIRAKRLAEYNIQEFINSNYGKAYKALLELEEKQRQEEAERKALEESKRPICPVCGSKNTKRLSTTNRAVSIAVVGLASDKIGKQYECFQKNV